MIVAVPLTGPVTVAVSVTVIVETTLAGGVYVVVNPDAGVIVPQFETEQESVHAGVAPLLATEAVKSCEPLPAWKVAVFGETLTVTTGEVTVIVAVAVFVGSVTDFAVKVTVAGDGTLFGAV